MSNTEQNNELAGVGGDRERRTDSIDAKKASAHRPRDECTRD